jgi:hypothetical protein
VRLLPEGFFSHLREKRAGDPSPLLCLAPHGVFRAAPLTRTPGGLLPRLFTLTQHHPAHFQISRRTSRSPRNSKVGWMVLGGMFSVTLSVARDLHPKRPRFHGACCLPVFGLSSGKTAVKPAITRHG